MLLHLLRHSTLSLIYIIIIIINPNPCSEPAIIMLVGYLLTSRYVQLSQTVVTVFVNCNWIDTRWQYYCTRLHKTIHRTTQVTTLVGRLSGIRTQSGQTNWEECGPCPVFAICTLAFALQLRKKHG
jgi:hypothetical protein